MIKIEGSPNSTTSPDVLVRNNNIEVTEPVDTVNEFENTEIEQKFQVLGNPQPGFLDNIVNTLLKTGNYSKVEGLDELKWVFHFDYYGYDDGEKPRQVFHLIHHESTPKFWIRRKLLIAQPQGVSCLPLVRKEEKTQVDNFYTDEYAGPIAEQYGDLLGRDVHLLGRLTRRKYYLFLRNDGSQRIYNIGLDFCEFSNKQMSQLEIEYKGKDRDATEGFGDLSHLMNEFDQLNNTLLLSSCGNSLERTSLTKFEWMMQIKKELATND